MEDTIEVPSEWWSNWALKSSPVWFLGVHCYDLFRFFYNSIQKKYTPLYRRGN